MLSNFRHFSTNCYDDPGHLALRRAFYGLEPLEMATTANMTSFEAVFPSKRSGSSLKLRLLDENESRVWSYNPLFNEHTLYAQVIVIERF